MEKKSKRAIMIISLTLAMVAASLSASYAWLVSNGESDSVTGKMGTVEVEISEKTKVEDGELTFTITNDSNIDTYMRLGWTPIYRNAAGNDLTTDTSGITITGVNLASEGTSGLKMVPGTIDSFNDYPKETIILIDSTSSKYFRVHGEGDCEKITGTITVDGNEADANKDEYLHIILVPEAIQATKAAVNAAQNWGWDEDLVGNQACTIVGGGE